MKKIRKIILLTSIANIVGLSLSTECFAPYPKSKRQGVAKYTAPATPAPATAPASQPQQQEGGGAGKGEEKGPVTPQRQAKTGGGAAAEGKSPREQELEDENARLAKKLREAMAKLGDASGVEESKEQEEAMTETEAFMKANDANIVNVNMSTFTKLLKKIERAEAGEAMIKLSDWLTQKIYASTDVPEQEKITALLELMEKNEYYNDTVEKKNKKERKAAVTQKVEAGKAVFSALKQEYSSDPNSIIISPLSVVLFFEAINFDHAAKELNNLSSLIPSMPQKDQEAVYYALYEEGGVNPDPTKTANPLVDFMIKLGDALDAGRSGAGFTKEEFEKKFSYSKADYKFLSEIVAQLPDKDSTVTKALMAALTGHTHGGKSGGGEDGDSSSAKEAKGDDSAGGGTGKDAGPPPPPPGSAPKAKVKTSTDSTGSIPKGLTLDGKVLKSKAGMNRIKVTSEGELKGKIYFVSKDDEVTGGEKLTRGDTVSFLSGDIKDKKPLGEIIEGKITVLGGGGAH